MRSRQRRHHPPHSPSPVVNETLQVRLGFARIVCLCFFSADLDVSTYKVSRVSVLLSRPPGAIHTGQATAPKSTQVKYIEEPAEPRFGGGGVVAHAVIDEPRIGHEQGERCVRKLRMDINYRTFTVGMVICR